MFSSFAAPDELLYGLLGTLYSSHTLHMTCNHSGTECILHIACFEDMLCHTKVNPFPFPCHISHSLQDPSPLPSVTYYVVGPVTL